MAGKQRFDTEEVVDMELVPGELRDRESRRWSRRKTQRTLTRQQGSSLLANMRDK